MKKNTMTKNKIPGNYPLCMNGDCPVADTCLHQLAFRRHDELGTLLKLINPSQCTGASGCSYYRDCRPVRFAKGFTNFKEKMLPKQYDKFMTLLVCHFGRNQYFKRRRGEILLPPAEQDVVMTALEKAGVNQPMDFDTYVEKVDWKE